MAPTMQATAQPIKLGPLPPTNINSQRQGGPLTRPGTASASSMYSQGESSLPPSCFCYFICE